MKAGLIARPLALPGSDALVTVIDRCYTPAFARRLYEVYRLSPYRFVDADRPDERNIRHFVHVFDSPNDPRCEELVSISEGYLRAKRLRYRRLQRVYANFGLYGDMQLAHDDGNCWTFLFFVNDRWDDDWGGEILLYTKDRSVALAIAPRPARALLFDGRVLHRGGAPSKVCFEPRITVAVKFDR